jgi:hypothetical protein
MSMPILKKKGSVEVQTLGGENQEATILRGVAAHLREKSDAVVEERESMLIFTNADLGVRWPIAGRLTASQGDIRVCSFGQLTTVSYNVTLQASAVRPVLVAAVVSGVLANYFKTPAPPAIVAIMFGLLAYGFVYRMLDTWAAGWFEIRLTKLTSSASYG